MHTSLVAQFVNPIDRNLTAEPTGFVVPADVTVSYDSTTRKITLTGDPRALWRGANIDVLVSGWESAAHNDVAGVWFLYYNGTAFIWSNDVWEFDQLMIAAVEYQAAYKFALREPHGLMPHECHRADHKTTGTYRDSGGDLSGFTLNSTTAAERRPLISSCTIWDEDVPSVVAALNTESYTRFWLTGTETINFATASADIVSLSGNQPYFNEFTGGAWTQTLLGNNNYMSMWLMAVPVTSDAGSQPYRFIWVQGQSQGTLSAQQSLTTNDLDLGVWTNLIPEFVFIEKVIIRYTSGNWVWVERRALTGSRAVQVSSPAGFFLSSVSVDGVSLSGDGTTTNPLALTGVLADGASIATGGDTIVDALYFG